MKRKNILLIVFMLTLFVVQQVQAGGTIPFVEKRSEINAPLATAAGWADVVLITIYPLNMNTGTIVGSNPCDWATYRDGCGQSEPLFTGTVTGDLVQGYSVDCNNKPSNPYSRKENDYYYLCIDGDYLPDVLPHEMNIGQIRPPEPEALKALAVAARTFVKYKKYWPWGSGDDVTAGVSINNSVEYQVYVPNSRSDDYSGVNYKNEMETAVNSTSGQYLSYNGNVIDAEYSSEVFDETQPGGQNYLIPVKEPISSRTCTTQGSIGNSWGISQRGAIRWARGNTCPDGSGEAWPVSGTTSPIKWGYKQILVHYYTGVDIAGTNTPNDRWNLLKYELPNGATATVGTPFNVNVMLQNTSTSDWNGADIEVGYHWGDQVWHGADTLPSGSYPKGKETAMFLVQITEFPANNGTYTLHLDLRRNGGAWFSSGGWPDAQIEVQVSGATATPTITLTVAPNSNYALHFQPITTPKAILMPSAPNLNFGTDMTVEFWVRTISTYGGANWYDSQWILDKDVPGSSVPDWGVTLRQGKITSSLGFGISTVSNDAWHHVAMTRNTTSGQLIFYIDGIQEPSTVTGSNTINNTLALIVGSENGVGGPLAHAYVGDLDELRIWNIVRTQSDIQANMSTLLSGNEAGLVGYWDFNEGSGQTVHDKSLTQAHGQLGSSIDPDAGDPAWILASELFNSSTPTPLPTPTGSTSTALPPNYTPPPTTPAIPTATPPPPTSPVETCDCPIDFLEGIWCNLLAASGKLSAPIKLLQSTQQAILDVQLFHRVEDEVLSQTPEGQHYIELYYANGPEIIQILSNDPALKDEAIATLQLWEPNLQALVDGQGGSVTITSGEVQAVQTFLDHLYTAGSPELRQTIDNERTIKPLEQTIGLPMNQASVYLVDHQGPPTAAPTETSTPTLTPTNTATATFTPLPTATLTPTNIPVNFVFANGFESGNFSAWGWANTDGGDLSVSAQAAAVGSYGMSAFFDDGNDLIVYDYTPNNEKQYSARFYFDPNSMQMISEEGFYLLGLTSDAVGWSACIYFEQQGDYYSLGLCGKDDAGSWLKSDATLITDDWQAVEIDWQAASAPGANNGYIKLRIGDQIVRSIENIDSDNQSITSIMWGPNADTFAASGTMYFDAFASYKGNHIGLDPNGPAVSPAPARPNLMFADTFESGDLSNWNLNLSTLDGGDLSASALAARQSNFGLQALIDDLIKIKLLETSPVDETEYHARFYFHPNSISMSSGSSHFIFEGAKTSSSNDVFGLELFYESGAYKLRPRLLKDSYSNAYGSKYTLSNNWHVVEIEWHVSTAPGANNGSLSLWIDDVLMGTISNVDNDLHRLDQVMLGVTEGVDSTTSGSMLFDHFESHRSSHIGP